MHDPEDKPPRHLVEIQLHGISVIGEDVPQAIALWMATASPPEEPPVGDGS